MELIDVFDEDNKYLGYSLERNEVHHKNLWHHHVSAWIMNYEGMILLQQRAFTKKKNPLSSLGNPIYMTFNLSPDQTLPGFCSEANFVPI